MVLLETPGRKIPTNLKRVSFDHRSAEYIWDDGRKSYPLFFLYWCPQAVNVADGTLYASTKSRLCNNLAINKVRFERLEPFFSSAKPPTFVGTSLALFLRALCVCVAFFV
jgi:hypothetical protein